MPGPGGGGCGGTLPDTNAFIEREIDGSFSGRMTFSSSLQMLSVSKSDCFFRY